MNSKVALLLNKAKKLDDETLSEGIEALEGLGENAGVRSKEYKALLASFNEFMTKDNGAVKKSKSKAVDYKGIKMIGSLFYSVKDDYGTGFTSADECAQYFNGE